mgnify:CR=1 FL=1
MYRWVLSCASVSAFVIAPITTIALAQSLELSTTSQPCDCMLAGPGLGFEIDEEKLAAMPPPTPPSERRLYGYEEGMQPMYDGSIRRG